MYDLGNKVEITIKDLKRHDLGYSWKILVNCDSVLLEQGEYHTNNYGRGLWKDNRQILGTFEFELSNNPVAASAKIRRYFKDKWQYGLSKRLSKKTIV